MIIPWLPQKGDTEEAVEKKRLEISALANEFTEEKMDKLESYLAEFPQEEGHAPTARKDALYSIVREFLDWLTVHQK